MARGGPRRPKGPQGPSGPGKFSRRVDANQPKQAPDLDHPDLEYGDVQRLEDAQSVAPLPRGVGTLTAQGGAPPQTHPAQQGERLPDFMTELPTGRPDEPGSAGLSLGPGPGPEALTTPEVPQDTREAVLMYLATGFNNADAQEALQQYRASRGDQRPAVSPLPNVPNIPQPVEGGGPTLPMSGMAAEPPVEPPAPLAPEGEEPTLPPAIAGEEPAVEGEAPAAEPAPPVPEV